jgi:hypothetical protein
MAAGREALNGVEEGLRAVGAAINDFGIMIKHAAILCSRVTSDTARVSYNLAGEYTLPIEQELMETQPPAAADIPLPGKLILFLPLTLPTIILSVTFIPLIGNSIQSAPRIFVHAANLALLDSEEDKISLTEDKRTLLRHFYGLPGAALGGIAGCIGAIFIGLGRVITNFFKSIPICFIPIVNSVLHPDYAIENTLDQSKRTRVAKALGIFGLGFGIVAGIVGFVGIALYRLVSNTLITAAESFCMATNFGLPERHYLKFPEIQRNATDKSFGLLGFGFALGGIPGLFTAFIVNTVRTGVRSFEWMTNLGLHPHDKIKSTEDKRSSFCKFMSGLGLIPGGLAGVLGLLTVASGRFITNTGKSFHRYAVNMTNLGLPQDKLITLNPDTRNVASRCYGFLGAITGSMAGIFSAIICSTAITLVGSFLKTTNIALAPENEFILGEDKRSLLGKMLGGIGIIGVIPGLLSLAAVGVGRWLINSSISFRRYFKATLNLGLNEDTRYIIEPDLRSAVSQRLGTGGRISGTIVGFVAAVVASSIRSAILAFKVVTAAGLHPDDALKQDEDKRSALGKKLGYGGLVLGGMSGFLSIFFIGVGRVITNTAKSFGRTFLQTYNLGLPANDLCEIIEDKRNLASHCFGVAGILLGGISGLFAAFTVGSMITFGYVFSSAANLVLHKENEIKLEKDTRPALAQVIGCLGLVGGVICGGLAMMAIFCGRIIGNSVLSSGRAFSFLTNLALHQDDKIILSPDARNLQQKTFGASGLILGGIAGVIAMGVVLAGRWCSHTLQSFAMLGGSLMNCGLQKRYFHGVGSDNRHWQNKAAGFLGYATAAITFAPLAAVVFFCRYVPEMLSITLGVIFSPLVFAYKLAQTCKRAINSDEPRFPPGELMIKDKAGFIQGFKNIYSSLTPWGTLKNGAQIMQHASGDKSRWTFFRKSITFNARSLTEKTLDTLLADYRKFADTDEGGYGKDFFSDDARLKESTDAVKEYYKNGCCVLPHEIIAYDNEIDRIAAFVKTYMRDRIDKEYILENVGPPGGLSWRVAFWGNNENQVEPGLAPEVPPPLVNIAIAPAP